MRQQPLAALLVTSIALWLAWEPLRTAVALHGQRAIRRVLWNESGSLSIVTNSQPDPQAARPTLRAARFGARWIWLSVRAGGRTYNALIDRAVVEPAGYVYLVWLLRFRHSRGDSGER